LGEEQEENLMIMFKKMEEEITKLRENMELLTSMTYEVIVELLPIITTIQYDYSNKLDEALKLFQWYAEKQTGREYT